MKFLDYLFHGKELRYIDSYFKMLNGYSPTFTSYNGGVYEMDLTRTAVNSFATHCSKLKPEIEGSALKSLEKTLQHKPNYFMDTTKFIKRLATYVAVEHTAFIIPIEDEYGRLCGWYPLRAQRCEVVEAAGQVYLRLTLWRALLNRNGVMDIWNMAHVEDGEKYYIRKEYTEVSELQNSNGKPQIIIQQAPIATGQQAEPQQTPPAAAGEPAGGLGEKEGVNNAD